MTVVAGSLLLGVVGCSAAGAPATSATPTATAATPSSVSAATPSETPATGAVDAAACKSIVNSYLTLQTAYIDGLGKLTEQPSTAYATMADAQAAFAAEVDKLPAGAVKEKATAEQDGFAATLASFTVLKGVDSISALSQTQRDELSRAVSQTSSSPVITGAGLVELCTPYLR
ncbi:hypothetical protein [Microbacterium hominis]|uniref:Lipoprotein n=1 Tax=Microbacterium hominis TaxID=162426 RepID=A0A0B4DUJ9_9MICO|nr:hypothetical protein [Microbacterium hominis]KIC57918.1 hypothetical protein RM52_07490 [Microbacterium hominis]